MSLSRTTVQLGSRCTSLSVCRHHLPWAVVFPFKCSHLSPESWHCSCMHGRYKNLFQVTNPPFWLNHLHASPSPPPNRYYTSFHASPSPAPITLQPLNDAYETLAWIGSRATFEWRPCIHLPCPSFCMLPHVFLSSTSCSYYFLSSNSHSLYFWFSAGPLLPDLLEHPPLLIPSLSWVFNPAFPFFNCFPQDFA